MTPINPDTKEILDKVYNFLLSKKDDKDSPFFGFPDNCCFDSCFFLELFLSAEQYEQLTWVWGQSSEFSAHVWIESKDFVIDLTSSQFNAGTYPYLFYRKGEPPNGFHESFTIIKTGLFDRKLRKIKRHRKLIKYVQEFRNSPVRTRHAESKIEYHRAR